MAVSEAVVGRGVECRGQVVGEGERVHLKYPERSIFGHTRAHTAAQVTAALVLVSLTENGRQVKFSTCIHMVFAPRV